MRHVHVSIVVVAAIAPTVARAQGTTVSTTPRLTGYLQPRFQAVGDSASLFPSSRCSARRRWRRPSIVNAAKRDIGAQAEWRLPDRLLVQAAVVNGEGPNRATNPDNRMAYYARAVVTPVKGLDVGGAFEGYSDSTGVDGQVIYKGKRWSARAEYIGEKNRRTDVRTTGWYALATFRATPQRVQLVARVQQFDPSNQVTTDRSTGYLLGVQYFIRGDDFKLLGDYEVFREQSVQLDNNRGVIQMQVRW